MIILSSFHCVTKFLAYFQGMEPKLIFRLLTAIRECNVDDVKMLLHEEGVDPDTNFYLSGRFKSALCLAVEARSAPIGKMLSSKRFMLSVIYCNQNSNSWAQFSRDCKIKINANVVDLRFSNSNMFFSGYILWEHLCVYVMTFLPKISNPNIEDML